MGAAFARADPLEPREVIGRNGHDVALLRFVAPDFHWRHAGVGVGHVAQLEKCAARRVGRQLGQRVGQPSRTDVVDAAHRVVAAERAAPVDDFLAAPLHLGVVALHRGEVELAVALARAHARSGAAAESDQHGGTAQDDQLRPFRDIGCVDVSAANGADAAGDHDGFVVAPGPLRLSGVGKLEGAEVAAKRGPAVLVVEARGADGSFQHDVERARDPFGLADRQFPGLRVAGDVEVRRGVADQPRFRLGTPADGALVAYFSPGARRGARIGRDGGGMVVGFHLHEDVRRFAIRPVDVVFGIGEEAVGDGTLDDRGVVRIGGKNPLAVDVAVGVPDHLEQRRRGRDAIDFPVRVEDLVPAVLRVRLGEHHEFRVRGVAVEIRVLRDEVVDLVLRKRESEANIGGADVVARECDEGPRLASGEDIPMRLAVEAHHLRHAVVQ